MTEAKARGLIHAMNSTQYGEHNPEDTQEQLRKSGRLSAYVALHQAMVELQALPVVDKESALAVVASLQTRLWRLEDGG